MQYKVQKKRKKMFKKTSNYADMLGLTKEEYEVLLKRLAGHYKRHEIISKKVIDNSFFILEDILKNKMKLIKEKQEAMTKNIVIRKYYDEIVLLRTVEGFGATKIIKTLIDKYEDKDSKVRTLKRSTVDNFLRENNLKKGEKNG